MAYFENINKVQYEGVKTDNPFAFRHYNPEEIVLGKTMKEHLRFGIAYWHTMTQDGSDPFGSPVNIRNWCGETPMETAKNRVEAFFEILEKLGVEYFCFHDVDVAPEGDSLEEFFQNIDEITDLIKEKMDQTGIKLLWNTANMFSNPRFVNGAASSNNADVFAHSAAQVKKGLDISKKLGGENYVFWGGREGYESLLNTDMKLEQDNIARLFKMAIAYGEKINHKPQFLIEPKPKEPSSHQYDYDAATAMAFIQKYGLEGDFKLNLEGNHATLAGHTFEHELAVARCYDALESIDANQGHPLLGWDTDEFPTNIYEITEAMLEIIPTGGFKHGGINFDAKTRRNSTDLEDIFIAHIGGMDVFARSLVIADKILTNLDYLKMCKICYFFYDLGKGAEYEAGKLSLEDLYAIAAEVGEPAQISGKQELIEQLINWHI